MSVAKRMGTILAIVAGAVLTLGLAFAASSNAAPYTNQPVLTLSTSTPLEGSTLTVAGSGFGGGDTINITLHTATYNLGSVTTTGSGTFSTQVTLPAGVTGQHTIVATDANTGQTASASIDIIASGSSNGGTSSSSGGLSNTGVAVMSIGGLGVLLLLGGGVMLMAGRRRKSTV